MGEPELRVVYGDPTGEELCALICALRLVAAREAEPPSRTGVEVPRRTPQAYRSPRSWSTSTPLRRS